VVFKFVTEAIRQARKAADVGPHLQVLPFDVGFGSGFPQTGTTSVFTASAEP
jgi:hypothetical protein